MADNIDTSNSDSHLSMTNIVCHRLSTGVLRRQWPDNFRMSKESMPTMVRQLRHDVERRDTHMQKAIDVEHRIACVMWVLAAQCGYRTAGHLFGICHSSV